jgi:hypothetical protein
MTTPLWDITAWTVQDLKDAGPTLVGLLALVVTPVVTLRAAHLQSRRAQSVADMQATTSRDLAQLQMGNSLKVANKQIITPIRQKWIETLRDTVAELISVAAWMFRVSVDPKLFVQEEYRTTQSHDAVVKIAMLLSQIELMLNKDVNPYHNELMETLRQVCLASYPNNQRLHEFEIVVQKATSYCLLVIEAAQTEIDQPL